LSGRKAVSETSDEEEKFEERSEISGQISAIVEREMLTQGVQFSNGWQSVPCNGRFKFSAKFPNHEGFCYVVHQVTEKLAFLKTFQIAVINRSWLIDSSMVRQSHPIMGLETDVRDKQRMALYTAQSMNLSFVVDHKRSAISFYYCKNKEFKEAPLRKEFVVLRSGPTGITICPVSSEILNFRPMMETTVGKIVVMTDKVDECHNLLHYLSVVCTSDCAIRSGLSEKAKDGEACNVDFRVKKCGQKYRLSAFVND